MLPIRLCLCLLLGFLLGLSNLYIALRLGFTVGVAILTAFCWAGLDRMLCFVFRGWSPLSPSDHACFLSFSSAMSYGCGTVVATSLAALLMADPEPPPGWLLALWVSGICGLGTCLALPLRKRMLDQLPFPSGRVASETVIRISKKTEDMRPFLLSLGGVWGWVGLRDLAGLIPQRFPMHQLSLQFQPLLIGLGALLGPRTCLSMFAGSCAFLLAEQMLPNDSSPRILWFAVGTMVSAGLIDFFRSLGGTNKIIGKTSPSELPYYRFTLVSCSFLLATVHLVGFGFSLSTFILVPLLVWLFAAVSCRVTGETDVVPTGALGKLSILLFGLAGSGGGGAMAATGVLTGGAAASADFVNDLRCGAGLNCPVERQFRYQLAGAMIGPLLLVPVFLILIEGPNILGGEVFPAPAAQIWLQVSRMVDAQNLSGVQIFVLGLAAGGVGHFVCQRFPWMPSPVPFAMAAVLDWSTTFTLLVGAGIGYRVPKRLGFPIWCAMIAGESAVALLILLS